MTALRLEEAAELLPALIHAVASDVGVRLLLVKGAAADHHALRPPRRSGDVDVLVDPAGFDRLRDRLVALGWQPHAEGPVASRHVRYAGALRHPIWPLELDLHRAFPGFVRPEAKVFDALWADRVAISLAGQDVDAAGWAGSVLIGALHGLRRPTEERSAAELRWLAVAVAAAPAEDRAALRRLAAETGAARTAAPLLAACDDDPAVAEDRAVARISATAPVRGVTWLTALRGRPLRSWPGLVMRALLGPGEASLRATYPAAGPGRGGLWRARWWRLRDVLRQLPAALRAVLGRRR